MVQLFGSQLDVGSYERIIGVTICTMVCPGVVNIVEASASGDDHVQLVPMFRPWMSPGRLVACFVLEERIGHTQFVIVAEFKKSLAVFVQFPNAVVA